MNQMVAAIVYSSIKLKLLCILSLALSHSLAPRLLILLLVAIDDDLANVHTRVIFSCVFCYCLDLCRRHFHSQDNIISRTKLPKVCACVVCI